MTTILSHSPIVLLDGVLHLSLLAFGSCALERLAELEIFSANCGIRILYALFHPPPQTAGPARACAPLHPRPPLWLPVAAGFPNLG